MGRKKVSCHRQALEKIASQPELIHIKRDIILSSSIEQQLYLEGKFYCEPDLVFMVNSAEEFNEISLKAIIIEYKANGTHRAKNKGESQLAKAVDYYQKVLLIPSEGRLITGSAYPKIKSG
jgi:hypothetical protein